MISHLPRRQTEARRQLRDAQISKISYVALVPYAGDETATGASNLDEDALALALNVDTDSLDFDTKARPRALCTFYDSLWRRMGHGRRAPSGRPSPYKEGAFSLS